eukprot:TRINITY_DN28686_c0_g1_i1.p1 TRINITY_DN28686_c0_g1~~TRINITY_DN28686_c0_g1_i1.p1  ORF type:complete len:626 (-),score=111.17 TRINITY_DN28686_c0_g1_i1:182-2059(-)
MALPLEVGSTIRYRRCFGELVLAEVESISRDDDICFLRYQVKKVDSSGCPVLRVRHAVARLEDVIEMQASAFAPCHTEPSRESRHQSSRDTRAGTCSGGEMQEAREALCAAVPQVVEEKDTSASREEMPLPLEKTTGASVTESSDKELREGMDEQTLQHFFECEKSLAAELRKQRLADRENAEARERNFQRGMLISSHEKERTARVRFQDEESKRFQSEVKTWSTSDFESVRVLGKGGFGIVHLVWHEESSEYHALKRMSKPHYQQKNIRKAWSEREALLKCTGQWCVDVTCMFQDSSNVYLVMEFVQGGDFFSHIESRGKLTIQETAFYMAELIEAVDAVHEAGFIHRDLKPENIVITAAGHLKLLDFGLCARADLTEHFDLLTTHSEYQGAESSKEECTAVGRASLHSKCGTPHYMAPEAFDGCWSPESDVWAVGIITYECLTGSLPFDSTQKGWDAWNDIKEQVLTSSKKLPVLTKRVCAEQRAIGATEESRQSAMLFIAKILCSRKGRLSLVRCRQDAFFSGLDFQRLLQMQPPFEIKITSPCDASAFDEFPDEPLPPPERYDLHDPTLTWGNYDTDAKAARWRLEDQALFPRPRISRAAAIEGASCLANKSDELMHRKLA